MHGIRWYITEWRAERFSVVEAIVSRYVQHLITMSLMQRLEVLWQGTPRLMRREKTFERLTSITSLL
jgi:hypothetical protein